MIEMNNISKSFTMHGQHLSILSVPVWKIQQSERIALLGPSGSGKSTLLHLLSGVMIPDEGEIWVNGLPLHDFSQSKRDRFRAEHVGYIFQDFHLISSLTARQNVELIAPHTWSKKQTKEQLDDWFERVGLKDRQHHMPYELSRGQQQRAAIIRALLTKPQLVLADEPTGSLDWETAGEVMSLLLHICESEKLTLVTVTHDLHLAEMYPKRVQIGEINEVSRRNAV
ncbi:ABC transporter ATP-binding protein [Paenibacillus aceris]|uniref:ABC transport system ATP-binding protein n=1 Tax=Paenibacillus aceris TaxID=869555 RepID=A0ABS4HSA1_9BACL|nr:ABC transporter ATP-binding protein [Paenibacillus aceris]MBP1961489.1 putative ABC transport system ATP-binding protein [Paenibacillus aceris]NHW37733.1 ABC transporter ATP-binding protein [Paenibacillus aceris]